MRINITKNLDLINLGDPVRNFVHTAENILKVDIPVEEAIESLGRRPYNPLFDFYYVIDHSNILCGVISSHKLLHGRKGKLIQDLMERNVIKLKDRYSVAEALLTLAEERLIAIPIINEEGVFLGIVELSSEIDPLTFDGLTHARMKKKATKDLYSVLGLSIDQNRKGVIPEYCNRMPWIFGNIFSGLICALILYLYQGVVSGTFLLAMFIPLVLTLCESIAMQATINTSHYLNHSKIPWRILLKRGGKEMQLAFLIAGTAAVFTGLITLILGSQFIPMMVISLSIFIAMIIASGLGMGVTIFVHNLGWDHKFASGPTVLMFTDIITTAAYFTIAYLILY